MHNKYLCVLIHTWIKGEVGAVTDCSKAVLLLWIFDVFVLSCICYVFVRVYLYVLCGHLLGKGWPLGSRLWCLLWVCHFPIGILGQVWYLIVSIPDLCTLTYFKSCEYYLYTYSQIIYRWERLTKTVTNHN